MANHRLLIVEDHEPTRQALRGIFRRYGREVVAVGTVAEGLAELESAPDCVVLDLTLPDECGEEVLQKTRDQRLPTRVAVRSGCGDPSRGKLVASLRPDAILEKPIEVAEVCTACSLG
jgi:DNA-binding response OmpR family regulator